MPYKLRKAPRRDAFWVVNTETGAKHSNEALPRDRAEAQMRALYASEGGYEMRGKGRETPKGIPIPLLQVLARASYSGRTPLRAGGFELVRSTPTIKIYRRGDGIVVSVRGTDPLDRNDLVADFASVKGTLRETTRYKQDEAFLRKFQEDFPRSRFRYTAVGHSLGGAIIDGFFRDKLIDNAFSFNPMIEPHERGGNPLHRRLYNNEDPLYLAFGKGVKGVEVRDPRDPLWLAWAKFKLPKGLRELFALYDAHRLQKFKGGLVPFDNNNTKTLDDVITDIYPLNQKEDILEFREVPTGRTKVVKTGKMIPNPAFVALPDKQKRNTRQPPPDGVKGITQRIPETREEEITARRKVKVGEKDMNPIYYAEIDALEKDLRGLAHFYGFRDPASSLGFRVLADEIKNTMPLYQGRPKKVNNKAHNNSQYFTALTMMGENQTTANKGIAQPSPTERYNAEVAPLFVATQPPELNDPKNPMRTAVPKAGDSGWDIPPVGRKQKEFLLQNYPQVKGNTMYYDVNK